jgi:hypothetical protein
VGKLIRLPLHPLTKWGSEKEEKASDENENSSLKIALRKKERKEREKVKKDLVM